MKIVNATITGTQVVFSNESLAIRIFTKFDKIYVGSILLNLEDSSDLFKLKKLMKHKSLKYSESLKHKRIRLIIYEYGGLGEIVGFGFGKNFFLTNTKNLNISNYNPYKIFSQKEILEL